MSDGPTWQQPVTKQSGNKTQAYKFCIVVSKVVCIKSPPLPVPTLKGNKSCEEFYLRKESLTTDLHISQTKVIPYVQ